MSALFAATYPERVSHLVLWSGFARYTNTSDFSLMFPEEVIFRLVKHYGTGAFIKALMPSRANDPVLVSQFAKLERLSASPGAFKALLQQNALIDVRPILANVRVPTLVLHCLKDRLVPVENGRYLALRNSRREVCRVHGRGSRFLRVRCAQSCAGRSRNSSPGSGRGQQPDFERVLATVLFTDIVDSTNRCRPDGATIHGITCSMSTIGWRAG